jgi:hypothetical protein
MEGSQEHHFYIFDSFTKVKIRSTQDPLETPYGYTLRYHASYFVDERNPYFYQSVIAIFYHKFKKYAQHNSDPGRKTVMIGDKMVVESPSTSLELLNKQSPNLLLQCIRFWQTIYNKEV